MTQTLPEHCVCVCVCLSDISWSSSWAKNNVLLTFPHWNNRKISSVLFSATELDYSGGLNQSAASDSQVLSYSWNIICLLSLLIFTWWSSSAALWVWVWVDLWEQKKSSFMLCQSGPADIQLNAQIWGNKKEVKANLVYLMKEPNSSCGPSKSRPIVKTTSNRSRANNIYGPPTECCDTNYGMTCLFHCASTHNPIAFLTSISCCFRLQPLPTEAPLRSLAPPQFSQLMKRKHLMCESKEVRNVFTMCWRAFMWRLPVLCQGGGGLTFGPTSGDLEALTCEFACFGPNENHIH